jgi:hypothetical protein
MGSLLSSNFSLTKYPTKNLYQNLCWQTLQQGLGNFDFCVCLFHQWQRKRAYSNSQIQVFQPQKDPFGNVA